MLSFEQVKLETLNFANSTEMTCRSVLDKFPRNDSDT